MNGMQNIDVLKQISKLYMYKQILCLQPTVYFIMRLTFIVLL